MQGITPKKSLGQNFLKDKNIIYKIIDILDCKQDDLIIEIGPGNGALTEFLISKDINLIAVEFDSRAVEYLRQKYNTDKFKKFTLINDDIRNINIQNILRNHQRKKTKVIGNIPYNISSDILFWLFEQAEHIEKAVIMLQKEVAQRIVSLPRKKDYGILSIASDLVSNNRKAFDVNPTCFYPKPKVISSILEFTFDTGKYEFSDFKKIMKLVKAAFNQRRKVLRNSLKSYFEINKINNLEIFFKKYPNLEMFFKKRAEELTSKDFIKLYNAIEHFKSE